MLASLIVICGVLMVFYPKRMQAILILGAVSYAFPVHTFVIVSLIGIGYQLFKRYKPFNN